MTRATNYLKGFKVEENKVEETPDVTQSLEEGISPIDFKSAKEVSKKLPKEMAAFSKGWDKMWKEARDCQQKWSDEHLSMKFTLTNLRNTLEDADIDIPDSVHRDIRIVEEQLDSLANVHRWGGVAPMGGAKRQMKELMPRMEAIMSWAKTL